MGVWKRKRQSGAGVNLLNCVVGIFLMGCEGGQGASSVSEERAIRS